MATGSDPDLDNEVDAGPEGQGSDRTRTVPLAEHVKVKRERDELNTRLRERDEADFKRDFPHLADEDLEGVDLTRFRTLLAKAAPKPEGDEQKVPAEEKDEVRSFGDKRPGTGTPTPQTMTPREAMKAYQDKKITKAELDEIVLSGRLVKQGSR